MKNADQIKALVVAIEEKDNQIRMLMAQQGNHEVQIAEYRQIVKELSDKLGQDVHGDHNAEFFLGK